MEITPENRQDRRDSQTDSERWPLVQITRTFRAPVARLWAAWSEPTMMKQWWGPENFSCPYASIEFRPGGKCVLAMKDSEGRVIYSTGRYEEIIPNEKIVCTDNFSDEDGNVISAEEVGMPGDWPETSHITVKFQSDGADQTTMHLKHEGIPAEMHDDCVDGWSSSFDKLQRLVEGT